MSSFTLPIYRHTTFKEKLINKDRSCIHTCCQLKRTTRFINICCTFVSLVCKQEHLFANNGRSLANIDTVQELADILVLDRGDLLDSGSRLRDGIQAGSLQHNLVLLVSNINSHSLGHGNSANNLLSQVVADLNGLLAVNNGHVDGEVRVGRAHLVLESLGNTGNHVLDVGADGADAGKVLANTEPDRHGNLVFALASNLDGNVVKVLLQRTAGSGYFDLAAVQLDGDALGNGDSLGALDGLHYEWMDTVGKGRWMTVLFRGGRPGRILNRAVSDQGLCDIQYR